MEKRKNRPIKSDLKSHRIVVDEEKTMYWPFMKVLREYSTLKQFYPEIDPYVEVYKFRDNLYCLFEESMDGMGDLWMYLIDGPERAMLIDTGFGVGDLKGLVEHLIGDKELIVANTHHHFDHAYGNAQFDRCYCHEYEVPSMRKTMNPHIWDYLFNEDGSCKFTEFDRADLIPFKEYEIVGIENGHLFDLGEGYEVEAVLIPGHTPGQCAYYDHVNHVIFLGDNTGMGHPDPDDPYGEYCTVEALRDGLAALEPRFDEIVSCFPGHGPIDKSANFLQYMLDAANRILEEPDRYDEKVTHTIPSLNKTVTIMRKYVYQGTCITYTDANIWKHPEDHVVA